MAAFEDFFEGSNLWIGLGIAVAVPVILPVVGGIIRPVAKTAIKASLATAGALAAAGLGSVSRVEELMAATQEGLSDLWAEASHEYETGSGWLSRGGNITSPPAEQPQPSA